MAALDEYRIRLGPAGKYRIGLNAVRTGKIGVKGLVVEYGGYSPEYSPTLRVSQKWDISSGEGKIGKKACLRETK